MSLDFVIIEYLQTKNNSKDNNKNENSVNFQTKFERKLLSTGVNLLSFHSSLAFEVLGCHLDSFHEKNSSRHLDSFYEKLLYQPLNDILKYNDRWFYLFLLTEMLIISTIESIVQGGMVVTPCTQAAVGSEGRCIVLIVPEQEQAAGEIAGNRQNIPAEIDIWNVILSFKNSFALFLRYLGGKLNVTVRHHDLGSLLITVECSSLQILEGLWKDYSSGHLNEVAQETLVTAEVLEKLDLTEVRLKTFISEEEYKKGKKIFMEHSGKNT